MAGEFESKIVVISGGSRGIGRGIALAFARVGAQTVIASSSQSNLAAAAKANAAVANFSKGLSKLGNRDDVNVNVIHPGNADTERQQQLREQRAAASGRSVEELRAEALTKSNMRRFGTPQDIAALALFLCSEQ